MRSFAHAIAGVAFLLRTQHNAWIHAAATLLVCLAAAALRVSAVEWCVLVLAMAGVWTAEALNTAVELLADAVSPGQHRLIGKAKDVAAGAVLIAAAAAVVVGLVIFAPRLAQLAW